MLIIYHEGKVQWEKPVTSKWSTIKQVWKSDIINSGNITQRFLGILREFVSSFVTVMFWCKLHCCTAGFVNIDLAIIFFHLELPAGVAGYPELAPPVLVLSRASRQNSSWIEIVALLKTHWKHTIEAIGEDIYCKQKTNIQVRASTMLNCTTFSWAA